MSDHDREWIIGCIKHDGFIKTDRFDKANHIILDALEKNVDAEIARLSRPTDYISRADAMGAVQDHFNANGFKGYDDGQKMMDRIKALPSADAVQGEWVIRENGNKECSVCGHERQDGWDYFCGYCGARMKGGDSE